MANTWYPVIDYMKCEECGICGKKCTHGVYNKEKFPVPVVQHPQGCVDHCHGCGDLCPTGAITYVGDDTGWTPPNGIVKESEQSCGCGCSEEKTSSGNEISVEYLYLDLHTCERCIGTDGVLDEVMTILTPALTLAGYQVRYNKIEITTKEIAEQFAFVSSPTIRINGQDICDSVKENSCGCCSDISGTDVDCRVFEYDGASYEVPPKEMLAKEILRAVFAPQICDNTSDYVLPDNLKEFSEGKQTKSSCSCTDGCC